MRNNQYIFFFFFLAPGGNNSIFRKQYEIWIKFQKNNVQRNEKSENDFSASLRSGTNLQKKN